MNRQAVGARRRSPAPARPFVCTGKSAGSVSRSRICPPTRTAGRSGRLRVRPQERQGRPPAAGVHSMPVARRQRGRRAAGGRDLPEVPPVDVALVRGVDHVAAVRGQRHVLHFELRRASGAWPPPVGRTGYRCVQPSPSHGKTIRPPSVQMQLAVADDLAIDAAGAFAARARSRGPAPVSTEATRIDHGSPVRCASRTARSPLDGLTHEGDAAAVGRPVRVQIEIGAGIEIAERVCRRRRTRR